jgi:hypothetical protein
MSLDERLGLSRREETNAVRRGDLQTVVLDQRLNRQVRGLILISLPTSSGM